MSDFIKIPADIEQYVASKKRIKLIRCIIVFLISMTVAAVLILLNKELIFDKSHFLAGVLLSASALILPLFLCRPWRLSDTSFVGVVKQVRYDNVISTEWGPKDALQKISRNGGDMLMKTVLLLEIPNKKMERRTVNVTDVRCFSRIDGEYKVGDIVCYIDGTNFAFRIPNSRNERRNCVICGLKNMENVNKCISCGFTMLTDEKNDVYNRIERYNRNYERK